MVGGGLLMGVLSVALPAGEALAQGSCSVPQLGPGSPTASSALTEAPGSGWVQLTGFHLNTRQAFDVQADQKPYFAEGQLVLTSFLATAAVGLMPGVEVSVLAGSARFNFIYRPGSDIYLVFDDGRREVPGLPAFRDRQLILKLTYLSLGHCFLCSCVPPPRRGRAAGVGGTIRASRGLDQHDHPSLARDLVRARPRAFGTRRPALAG